MSAQGSTGRWQRNLAVVAPAGAVEVRVPWSRRGRRAAAATITDLGSGTPVVISASAPLARRRCRRFAVETGIDLAREFLAFPSAAAPAYLVDDRPAPIRVFVEHALVTPPGLRLTLPVDLGVGLARAFTPTGLLRLVAGRVAVGRIR